MEHHINIVASTVYLVAKSSKMRGNFGTKKPGLLSTYECVTACGDNKIYYENMVIDMGSDSCKNELNFDYYKKLFSKFSLPQLRDILYLVVPSASNFMGVGDKPHVNTLAHVKIIIKYIEKEIFICSSDDIKNNLDLINTNK